MFDHPDFDGHERVVHVHDGASGLRAIIALHSTRLGPAFGGCRLWPYASPAAALSDVLRLSRGMTHKSAICDLPYGGGKCVVLGDPARDKTPALLHALARAVEQLGGHYIIADDVGTTLEDLRILRAVTRHTAAASEQARQPLPVTAHGVFSALEAAVGHVNGAAGVAGLRVAVQGLGNVGRPLCELLHAAGARLVVSDLDASRAQALARELGATVVATEQIFAQDVDVFAPCALGSVLTAHTIAILRARIVCGGANNPLQHETLADALHARGVLYVPDFLASAGGVIDFHQESFDDSPAAVLAAVRRIGAITTALLDEARQLGVTPLAAAQARVRARLAMAAWSTSAPSP